MCVCVCVRTRTCMHVCVYMCVHAPACSVCALCVCEAVLREAWLQSLYPLIKQIHSKICRRTNNL